MEAELKRAKTAGIKYLARRSRSRREVQTYLHKKEYSPSAISSALAYLADLGYINDRQFAEDWGRSRIESRRFGKLRIRQELLQKGLDEGLIASTLEKLFSETDEIQLARSCAEKCLPSLAGLDQVKKKRRLAQRLQRKGFPYDIIRNIIETTLP